MASNYPKSLLYTIILLLQFLLIECETPRVPGFYVFGSSIVDSGNNNFLNIKAKVNYEPYGIDFPSGVPTGRFNNGKTMADFIAESLGLPLPPPYLGLSMDEKSRITTGVNYASGSAGILPETGSVLGDNLSLDDQINYFQETATKHLPKLFKTPEELSGYLSQSIFLVASGSNDFLNNYLQPANYISSRRYTPRKFSQFLLKSLKQRLTKLYELGARKFVVVDINPLGCLPATLSAIHMKATNITPCADRVNVLVNIFNKGLPKKLRELKRTLLGSTFVQLEVHGIIRDMIRNPSNYGLTTTQTPCCIVGPSSACLPNQPPCTNRNEHLYWDAVHMTQHVHQHIANDCFSGSIVCSPINVDQLARKQ